MYSKSLCKLQCKIDKMIEICGCLPFFLKTNINERYCDFYGMSCIAFYGNIFTKAIQECQCLENCENIKFHMKSKQSYTWLRGNSLRWDVDIPKYRIKREVIYSFNDVLGMYTVLCSRLNEMFQYESFPVSIGASFGLFLGVSVLSFTGFVYTFIVQRFIVFLFNFIKKKLYK